MVDSVLTRLVMPADPSQIAPARRLVRTELAPMVPAALLDDLQLVASELVTNAIQHGASGPVTLTIAMDDERVAITVVSRGPSPAVGPVTNWTISEAPDVTGRGLGIVRRVADRVEVDQSADRLAITAHHRTSHRTVDP